MSSQGRRLLQSSLRTVMTCGAAGPVLWAAIAGERGVSA